MASEEDSAEVLIAEVQASPALWNSKLTTYKNKNLRDRLYAKVEEILGISNWLAPDVTNDTLVNCKYCHVVLKAHKKDLVGHAKTEKHNKSTAREKSCKSISQIYKPVLSEKTKIAAFIAEHCSFLTVDHLINVLPQLDPSSDALKNLKLHRTKCSMLIKNVLGPSMLEALIEEIGDFPYSIIIDESTDLSTQKVLSQQTELKRARVIHVLEEDMENYVHFKLMGGKIIMRREVVPHIFECQPDRKRTATEGPARSLLMKRERKRLVAEAEAADEERVAGQPLALDAPSTSTAQIQEEVQQESESTLSKQKTIGVQVRPSFRSKYVDCKLTVAVQHSAVSPIRILCTDTATSPLKVKKAKTSLFQASSSSEKSFAESPSTSFASNISAASSDMYIDDKQEKEKQALNVTRSVIEQNPKFYLGVPNMWLPHLVDLLNGKTNLTKDNIYLTLMKIKLNDPFQRLGHMFGMSTGNASKIFAKTLAQLEPYLSTLIFWPPSEKIKYFLPIPFRARYHNVQSIIDCLEIEIEKPTNPVKQTLTWSEYKKCNTLKYLVSSTPDGFINFISIWIWWKDQRFVISLHMWVSGPNTC
ncbi:thap domain protein [Holotrichia oblita]|uniref:Thap domain protein n=1 Tax=Holotrichia oblita TaxID=644536 RepID=A0ACB9TMP2_HOLOL|nr:thap domain protein [Holotrichia oblita]